MFSNLKLWYDRMNTIQDTCFFLYHVEFQLYYDKFVYFCKKYWDGEPTPHTLWDFISMILCNKNPENVFFIKWCVGRRICHECGDLALFHRKFPIDPTHLGLSDITVKTWKWYEYVSMNPSYSSHVPSNRIDLLEDDIPILEFMDKFQIQIYKYIKHSHKSRRQTLEFKHSCEVFEPGTILSVVDVAKKYTFSP